MNYFETDLVTLHKQLLTKEISAVELTEQTLKRIAATDEKLKAYILVTKEHALKQAAAIDAQGIDADNLLSGIPVAIKDNILTKDIVTTGASKMLKNYQPSYDATVVKKSTLAGAITIGKTNLDELAMGSTSETSAYQVTRNAWDQDKLPGGSSGGSGATVAGGQVIAALGSDTGGSVRQPASYNGIVGMKPSYGRVSRTGVIAFASSLDQVGPLTRNVHDNAAMLNVLAGFDAHDDASSHEVIPDFTAKLTAGVKGMKIGLPIEFMGSGVSEGVKTQILAAARQLEALGAHVEEISLPHVKYARSAWYVMSYAEAAINFANFDHNTSGYRTENLDILQDFYTTIRSEGLGENVKSCLMLGTLAVVPKNYHNLYHKAAQIRTLINRDFEQAFADYDLIIGPTTPVVAYGDNYQEPTQAEADMFDILVTPANFAGLPALSINAGFSEGLPVGLQIIGPRFNEERVYQAAYAFEQVSDLLKQHPNL